MNRNYLRIHLLTYLLIIPFTSLLLACAQPNKLPPAKVSLAQEHGEMPIHWLSLPRPAPLPPLEHAAMLIPVSIQGVTGKELVMQFDLGTPSTVIYSNKWKSIHDKLTVGTQNNSQEIEKIIPSLTLQLGDMQVTAQVSNGINRELKL
jgi:hypothetical protein